MFLAGLRPDSHSRSDAFVLLRATARPRRENRVGSYMGRPAQTSAIRASFGGSRGSAAMHNRDGRARRGASTSQTRARSRLA